MPTDTWKVSVEKMYFEAGETIAFRLYCQGESLEALRLQLTDLLRDEVDRAFAEQEALAETV